eukprot:1129892-Amorphochlora_amoeboformis.AAC.1
MELLDIPGRYTRSIHMLGATRTMFVTMNASRKHLQWLLEGRQVDSVRTQKKLSVLDMARSEFYALRRNFGMKTSSEDIEIPCRFPIFDSSKRGNWLFGGSPDGYRFPKNVPKIIDYTSEPKCVRLKLRNKSKALTFGERKRQIPGDLAWSLHYHPEA